MDETTSSSSLITTTPSHASLILDLSTLLSTTPPPFIFVHDPSNSRLTGTVIKGILDDSDVCYAFVNAVQTFTPRLLYDTVINALARHVPAWEDGCANWGAENGARWNESVDAFLHGLRALAANKKNKTRMVLAVERAERLDENMPDLIPVLARLGEPVWRVLLFARH
jgi:origin recognition complex subunit 5